MLTAPLHRPCRDGTTNLYSWTFPSLYSSSAASQALAKDIEPLSRSQTSMAVFEDLRVNVATTGPGISSTSPNGWDFYPNYDAADTLVWGKNLGAAFANGSPCSSGDNERVNGTYNCPYLSGIYVSSGPTCSYDRKYIGNCGSGSSPSEFGDTSCPFTYPDPSMLTAAYHSYISSPAAFSCE